ncbi:MAG: formate dehydrogenase subunit delta [Azospirillaceae bacterium]
MQADRLVTMANQIAGFFAAYPEERAIAATADHMRQFWDPRMRAELARIAGGADSGLSPVALAAARRLTEAAAPA